MAKETTSWIPQTGDHVPEDKDKRLVNTPYGPGMVCRTRTDDGISEVELSNWTSTGTRKPTTLYAPSTSLSSIAPTIGCDVLCFAGRGRVIAIETTNDDASSSHCPKLTIVLSSWRLANRSRVKCYLPASAVQVVRAKRIYEMDVFEKIDHAFALKQHATDFFHQAKYLEALEEYSRAVGTVKYVQHADSSPNALRADLLVIMITCSNNAATCSIKLGHHVDRSFEFAKQALDLLEALEAKKGLKIHAELIKSGYTDTKVFGEWKVKACLILANGLAAKGNVDAALEILQRARTSIRSVPSSAVLVRNEREILKRTTALKEQRKAQRSKERKRAQAMFAETDSSATAETTASTTASLEPNDTTSNDDDDTTRKVESSSLDWFQSPFFLGSVGIAAGVAGTFLVYSQLFRKQRS